MATKKKTTSKAKPGAKGGVKRGSKTKPAAASTSDKAKPAKAKSPTGVAENSPPPAAAETQPTGAGDGAPPETVRPPEAATEADLGATAKRPPTGRRRGRWRVTVVLLCFVAVSAGAALTWPQWSKTMAPFLNVKKASTSVAGASETAKSEAALDALREERRQLKQQLEQLMQRIDSVESSVDTVKQMIRATDPPPGGDSSVAKLTERLEKIEKDGGAIKEILQRVDQLEKEGTSVVAAPGSPAGSSAAAAADTAGARALVLSVAGLRDAIAGGGPFDHALGALTALAGEDPEIRVAEVVLAKHAATGLATRQALQARFGKLAGSIVQASRVSETGGWIERARNRIYALVTWRRIDEGGGEASVDTIVVRAEKHLAAADLRAAVETLEKLSTDPKAAAVASPWMADAKARLAVEDAVATVYAHAVSLLVPAKPGTGKE